MSSNPIAALAGGIHGAGGSLSKALDHHRQVATHSAMREIDYHYNTAIANHTAGLREGAAQADHGRDLQRMGIEHGHQRDMVRLQGQEHRAGIRTQAAMDISVETAKGAEHRQNLEVAGRQQRKTIKAEGRDRRLTEGNASANRRDEMVVQASADTTRTRVEGQEARANYAAKSAANVEEIKARGSQERQTYGYKARLDHSLAPQPHQEHLAQSPHPSQTLGMPAAPKPAPAKRATKKAPAPEVKVAEIAAPEKPLSTRTLASKMKPVAKKASAVPKTPTTPTFSG